MKVLAIMYVPQGLWKFAGSERFFANLSRHIRTYGVDVDAIEPKPSLAKQLSVGYAPVEVSVPFLSMVYVSLFTWLLLGLVKSVRLHSKRNYDLILAANNNIFNFGLGFLVSRILRRPLVVFVHHLRWVNPSDSTSDGRLRPLSAYRKMRSEKLGRLGAIAQTLGAFIESKVYRAEMCTVLSEAVKKNLEELGCKKKVVVTGNAVDLDYVGSFSQCSKRYDAIFVGRFDEGKGVLELIEGWRGVVDNLPKARLALIGTGILHKEALRLSRNLKLEDNLCFTGFVGDERLFNMLSASKLYVSMSKTEGFSQSIAEALAKGLPVVSYDIPAVRENFGESKSVFLVKVGDVESFVKQVTHLLSLNESDIDYRALQECSSEYVRKFSWTDVSLKMYRALQDAAEAE